ncbi:hypothetical protein THASP1DRAFT_26021 [Thamnocephalis sphaerospora]|uniref:Uncharacterized protein n=1 Tax=Thamnocephalis sphaerospora TaxID=78915 RepID=A0A4P9XIG9_9FUNG|nr:hypothetical protein THASP1DRAFT_26021 [Thamnocephalis sphaerospora]|eukprot:RKP05495.1 hypothetical protein THASP1DRAFT_26021 [Thamnocephalis sphaerospora]
MAAYFIEEAHHLLPKTTGILKWHEGLTQIASHETSLPFGPTLIATAAATVAIIILFADVSPVDFGQARSWIIPLLRKRMKRQLSQDPDPSQRSTFTGCAMTPFDTYFPP